MVVVVSQIRVTSGNADALAAQDEALCRLSTGVYVAARPVLVSGRESLGEVAP